APGAAAVRSAPPHARVNPLPAPAAAAATFCSTEPDALCLEGGRYRVEASWTQGDGTTGPGHAVSLTGDTGYFWFFDAENVEVVVKSLDGCGVNSEQWFFAGGLTNVRVDLKVTDVFTNEVRTYSNPQGAAFRPIQDTSAFACDPPGSVIWTARIFNVDDEMS